MLDQELKYVGGKANFSNSQIQSLGELKYIGDKAIFINSQIQSLGKLKYIGHYADFDRSQVQSLGELKYIGGYADFDGSQVQSLGNLQFIMGNAYFSNSQIQSLGELKYVGSRVIYSNSPIDSKIEDIKRKSEGSTAEILVRGADEFMTSMNREFEQFGKEIEEEFTESQPKFQAIESEREVITLNDGKKITPTVIDGSTVFYHASSKKRIGRLRPNNAIQWGKAIYFSPSREDVVYEFGDENVTEVRLNLSNPVYTDTPDFSKVANRAIEIYAEEQIKNGSDRENYSLDDIEDGYYFGEAAKQLGYDAIIDLNPNNYGGEIAVIDEGAVIYPEDIKSISPPKGKSDSILFQSIGERGAEGIQIEQERNAIEIDSKLMSLDYTLRRPRENTLVFVPINKLLQRHAKDNPSYDVTKKENQIGNRVQKAKEFLINYLSDNSFINPKTRERTRGTKVTYEPSVVGLYGGKLSFEDGRHRVLAAQEMGATAVAVEIPKTQVNTFKEELGVVDKKEWLKAPNGKDTNLTPEQWVTVRTKRFKDWFGDWQNDPENASKVVDANGEPMVLYHGTFIERESGDWDEFSLEGTRSFDVGFHFGTKNAAQDRIDSIIRNETNPDFAFMSRGRDVSTPRMMPVFLNIKNELRLDEHDRMPSWRGMEILDKIFNAIENGTANSDVSEAFGNDIEKYHEDELAIRYDEYGEGYLSERAKKYPHYANPERQNRWIGAYLGSKGFYGIVYKNTVEDKGNDSFIVFSPNQIKSATSNVGTFSEGSPSIMFQTPIDEAFDKSQALLDAMSKRGGIITNLVVRFADRSSSLKKKLIEANLKNARDLFVAQAGAGSRAKFFIDENFSPIYNGLNKENSEYLDKIIQLRRIIQIDEDFDSKGKPRIIHPSDKNGVPLNKERAEANLVDYESMFGSALYNDLINRSDLYFDAYKKLLSIMRDNGLITKELYDNLKSLLYQPRKFLDQFVSFEEGETTLDVKDLALNEAQIKTLQNGSDSEIMMNSKLLLAFSVKNVFSRVARNKTYTAISEAVKDPANDWISNSIPCSSIKHKFESSIRFN